MMMPRRIACPSLPLMLINKTSANANIGVFHFPNKNISDSIFNVLRSSCTYPNGVWKYCILCSPCNCKSSQSVTTATTTFLSSCIYCSVRFMSVGRKRTHYYDILGLTSKATQKQIKTAYYALSKQYHPDVARDKKSHALFTEINEAYEVLGNIRKRRMYDRGMFYQRDIRVDDEGDDYTQHYKTKTTQSPYERGDRPPPPTGRSKIYNFDEFYKQHYNEIRERRQKEYKDFQHYKQMSDFKFKQGKSSKQSPILVSICLSLLLIMIIFNDQLHDYDRINHKGREK